MGNPYSLCFVINRYVIHITAGVYTETVVIPRSKTNLMFLGDGVGSTIITGFMSDSQPGMDTWSTATVGKIKSNCNPEPGISYLFA